MLRTEVWIAVALITFGLIGGLVYNWPRSTNDDDRDIPPEVVAEEEPASSSTSFEPDPNKWQDLMSPGFTGAPTIELRTNHLEIGDKFLTVGNYPAALREYGKTVNQLGGVAPPWLIYRLAIASEMEGDVETAETYYRELVRNSARNPATRLLGLVGLTRTWQAVDKYRESLQLLAELYLRYSSNEAVPAVLREQITYQLANVLQRDFISRYAGKDRLDEVGFHWAPPQVEQALELENRTFPDWNPLVSPNQIDITVLQKPSPDLKLIAIDAQTALVSVADFLNEMALQTELTIGMTQRAHEAIAGRSTKVIAFGQPLSLVMETALYPLGIVWSQEGDHVKLAHISEQAPAILKEFQHQQADRMLRQIELSFPAGNRRFGSLLHRGNLNLLVEDFVSAGERYEELYKLEPTGELAAKLAFNSAMLDLALGRRTEAIDRLFFAVDQSLNETIQSTSYAWIGRLELENGHPNRAIYAASRGLAMAKETENQQAILMTLAKAYLLESDPFSANKVLFNHASAITEPKVVRLAAVLGAYARFLGTTPSEGLRNEGERLVVALAALQSNDLTNFVDELLVGRAFFEVGFTHRAAELLKASTDHAEHDYWKRRIAYELAIHHFRSGEPESAMTLLTELSSTFRDKVGILAQLKLAEVKLLQKKSADCIRLCQQLWEFPLEQDQKSRTLSMMGQAYQQLGRHHAAAVCFSGMVPKSDGDPMLEALEAEAREYTPDGKPLNQ